ncbi:MAG: dockerin type I repeat-containing protein [Clostridia bacterium]|nr:dockerin type I repeat-containing protein [Clostridia bacterium]
MKRAISILLVMILLLAIPHAAAGETTQSHIIEADRVLIYNPLPYDAKGNTLFSGTLTKPQEDAEPNGDSGFMPGLHKTGKDYSIDRKTPDTQDFWVCTDLITYRYDKCTFRLAAEGAHCRIWTMENDDLAFSEEQTAAMLEAFETTIAPTESAYFGDFRDLSGDGKLEIVTYAMNSLSVCGFFDTYDLYTKEEITVIDPDDAESYNYLPIINVNSRMANRMNVVFGTLAHEFQHLILRSAVLASPANADRLGSEITPGLWLNEGFSMAAEELCYPGSVAEQGYVDAYAGSDKVRLGMSYQDFDATASDVGAYGQSFLFTEYLRTQCGDGVFREILAYWRSAESVSALSEAQAIRAELTGEQIDALDASVSYDDAAAAKLGSEDEILLSKLALAFRLAILFKGSEGLYAIGASDPDMPAYAGTGRKIEGGGALLTECNGSFTVPADADSGLVFVGIKDGAVSEIYSVPEPEEGFYVIAANYNGEWLAIEAKPSVDRYLETVPVEPNADGTIDAANANGAIFRAVRTENGFRFECRSTSGTHVLGRTSGTSQTMRIAEGNDTFAWTHFADGADRLQADGFYGRAVLFGSLQRGFGYFAPAYFENTSFAKPRLFRVTIMRGDANLDGKLTAADAALILRTVVGLSYMNEPMCAAGDADRDGEITAADAAKILRLVIQLDF